MTMVLGLLLVQGLLGAFDTLWFHEWKARLPSRPESRVELRLHAARDFVYAVVFATLGWVAWCGAWAWLLGGGLAAEVVITLWDFVEEDRTRRLAAGERVTHAIMAIVYGAFLATLTPWLATWAGRPTGFAPHSASGAIAWVFGALACGVALSGVRDLVASFGGDRLPARLVDASP